MIKTLKLCSVFCYANGVQLLGNYKGK